MPPNNAKTDIAEFFLGSPGPSNIIRLAKEKSFSQLELIKQAYPNIADDFQKMFYDKPKARKYARKSESKEPSYRIL